MVAAAQKEIIYRLEGRSAAAFFGGKKPRFKQTDRRFVELT
jgi:hypothetical protein